MLKPASKELYQSLSLQMNYNKRNKTNKKKKTMVPKIIMHTLGDTILMDNLQLLLVPQRQVRWILPSKKGLENLVLTNILIRILWNILSFFQHIFPKLTLITLLFLGICPMHQFWFQPVKIILRSLHVNISKI